MKSIKKLIIASALSMMTASCYAGSFLPNTEQQKSVDINFAAPDHLTVSLDQVPDLIAGTVPSQTAIAKLTVDSTSIKEFGARGVSGSLMDSSGSAWKITGKNSGKSLTVGFSAKSMNNSHGPQMWNGRNWLAFDTNVPLDIIMIGAQEVPPDTYPMTVDVVGYQP
ncbi:pilus assembly protein [Salmonella enterica subsp. enterica serovar Oranienburg]|nr:pilus assembly protein [Salmonella enterica]EBR8190291.1 pilus assembly protein [Salmonella enterica subsp. enterica serovar Oranienburg]EBQ5562747.1 pilus assembly protein [Salmonella enterica]EBW4239432.1 pilus assembly protein [Salmonella enterica subsp. enterica serovar Oranienburg]EBY7480501.1 pilus assembly protein [Salmonella enterica subsp. enterica serovar Oranienburg]